MSAALELLPGVRWRGAPVAGERLVVLLAALALEPAGVSDAALVEEVWGDDRPAHPTRALQVLVSRLRTIGGATLVERTARGYRLGLDRRDVDAWRLDDDARAAAAALADGDVAAADLADAALTLCASAQAPDGDDARARLLRAARRLRPELLRVRGLALLHRGEHAPAFAALLEAHELVSDDDAVLAALLRAEAATAGPAAALERYEAHRADLADRLGVGPDPVLQGVHRELLALDDPRRSGVRYDADELVGRDADLARVRAALAAGRLVTVVGPGGIGKTRVAHVVAREAAQPRVHVVELVGVASADDVVTQVGTALGVRGSVTARTVVTPAQAADVRARVVAELDRGPTLLVLDNCEHVLETVATLVAFLLASTRDLTVLATSRAPLRIGAERVVPLTQLDTDDGAGLFVRRALAVRPDADLDPALVRAVVQRLDGLPLAIELAAARVRTLTVREVADRLADRFALLRGRDRSAPERHRTLTAVIEWSWDLLDEEQQAALARLSLLHDGFASWVAEAVLGPDADDLVEALAEQSLLRVSERDGVARYRALETVREFAAARLAASPDADGAQRAWRDWAVRTAREGAHLMVALDQVERVAPLVAEQANLTDVLRTALTAGDHAAVADIVVLLGSLWTVTGDQPRLFAVADAVTAALTVTDAPPVAGTAAPEAAAVLVAHLSWMPGVELGGLLRVVADAPEPRGLWTRIVHATHLEDSSTPVGERLAALARSAPPAEAAAMWMWAALAAENEGDVAAATEAAAAGLALDPLPPYLEASLHAELAQLSMAVGDHHAAVVHSTVAWPLMERLHSQADAYSLRVATALGPLLDGDPDTAETLLRELGEPAGDDVQTGARMAWQMAMAEVARVRGDVEEALRRFDAGVRLMQETPLPGAATNPWLVMAAAGALVAHLRHGPAGDRRAVELRDLLADEPVYGVGLWFSDLPLNGVVLAALGAWALARGEEAERDDGVLLLAISQRWAYNRSLPVMEWSPLHALADAVRPGRVDALVAEMTGRPGPGLVPDAVAALDRLRRAWLTSAG